jgi:hypothetical protein
MTNKIIYPYQALEWGLVNEVVPSVKHDGEYVERATPEQIKAAQKDEDGYSLDLGLLDERVSAMAQELIEKFPESMRYTKQQVNFWKDLAWHQTIGHSRDWLSIHYSSWEPLEGMRAFVEKRPPDYLKLRKRAAEGRSSEFRWGPYLHTCPVCGSGDLPAEFEFCGVCGAELGAHPEQERE